MSSWPPHLPIAITASRTESYDSTRARAIASAASRVAAARSEISAAASSTPTWWARSRAARRSRIRRYSTRSASTASASGSPATGIAAAGSAPTAVSIASRTAYAAARVLPSVGSVSSRQCSGCRTRCWVSAALAPSTVHSRIAVPSSSATSVSIAAPSASDCASTSRSRPSSAASGSALAASLSVSGFLASPRRSIPRTAAGPSTKPIRTKSPLVVVIAPPPRSRRSER